LTPEDVITGQRLSPHRQRAGELREPLEFLPAVGRPSSLGSSNTNRDTAKEQVDIHHRPTCRLTTAINSSS
jgi:hypothetical protein